MSDIQQLLLPLVAFVISVLTQLVSFRVSKGRIGLLRSLFLALLAGLIYIARWAPDGYYFASSASCFACLWYCFFHFVNIGEASLRIRVLDEIREAGGSLTEAEIAKLYNPRTILQSRLQRLTSSRQLLRDGSEFRLGKPRLIVAGHGILALRTLIHGQRAAAQMIGGADRGQVFVLGGNGFVGRHLAKALAENGMAMTAPSSKELDLVKPAAAEQIARQITANDTLVMLSALTPEREKGDSGLKKNVQMAEAVASALLQQKVKHVVLLSSDAVYKDSAAPFTEDTPLSADDSYGQSHIQRELLLIETCRRLGIRLAVIRPCAVYGEGDTHNSYGPNRFMRALKERKAIELFGAGEDVRDHVHVEDLACLIAAIIRQRWAGTVNVATGQAVSFAEMAKWFGTEIKSLPRVQPASKREHRVTHLREQFPHCAFRPVREGIELWIKGR